MNKMGNVEKNWNFVNLMYNHREKISNFHFFKLYSNKVMMK